MRRFLVVLVVLVGLLIAADRIGVRVADHAVARQVRSSLQLQEDPAVTIHGFPFLFQVARGRYNDVEVTIPTVDAEQLHNLRVHVRLTGLHAPLGAIVNRSLKSVPVDGIAGTVSVSYADLASASGIAGLRIVPASNGAVTVSGTINALGRQLPASAQARVAVSGRNLVVTAEHATVGGIALPKSALDVAAQRLTFTVSARNLPLGLRITSVQAGADALTVTAQAQDTTLDAGSVKN